MKYFMEYLYLLVYLNLMLSKVSWAIVGGGGIARRRTIPEGIVPSSNARLAGMAEINPILASELTQEFGVPCYPTMGELLTAVDCEAVYIATPTDTHEPLVMEAAAAGKHILCEKPLALDLATGRRMDAACRAAGVKLGVGFMMRFHPLHQAVRALLAEGALGCPVTARAQIACWFPPMQGNWRQSGTLGGGGSLVDMAVHGLDLLEYLLGPVTEVSAMTGSLVHHYDDPDVEDSAVVMVRFAGGATGVVEAHFNIPDAASESVLEIHGSRGGAKTRFTVGQGSRGELRVCIDTEQKTYDATQATGAEAYRIVPLADGTNIYRSQIEAFSNAVANGVEPPVGVREALRSLHLCEAAYESARSGRRVDVPVDF